MTWHSVQGIACRSAPPLTCAWCAPTPTNVVAELPLVSIGGAGLSVEPWQEVQVSPATSTVPSMCRLPATSIVPSTATVSGWQELQSGFAGCQLPGGFPWQL